MIVWSGKLYIGEQVEKDCKKLQKKLEQGKLTSDIFLITKPSNESNLMDIHPANELLFPYHKKREILVYGLAKGKKEATTLVLTMLEDVYRETNGLCCKEYFETE